VTNFNH